MKGETVCARAAMCEREHGTRIQTRRQVTGDGKAAATVEECKQWRRTSWTAPRRSAGHPNSTRHTATASRIGTSTVPKPRTSPTLASNVTEQEMDTPWASKTMHGVLSTAADPRPAHVSRRQRMQQHEHVWRHAISRPLPVQHRTLTAMTPPERAHLSKTKQ